MDELDSHRLTKSGKRIYRRRKETVERSFADSKEMHGVRYARFRGLAKVRGQCLLVAACQNMKKIILVLHRRDKQFASWNLLKIGTVFRNEWDSKLLRGGTL